MPCVQFSNPKDAERLLNIEKFVVYKGVKIEFSSSPFNKGKGSSAGPVVEQLGSKKVKSSEEPGVCG